MNVALSSIELDTSIQCRAVIDTGVINDYAERMTEGDKFPPVELFGTADKCWIGDGWHRTLAAKSIEQRTVEANLHPGGRADALKHALGANSTNGHRRTNADKRRTVEIALREFPQMSSRALAQMCGVHHTFVGSLRPHEALATVANAPATRTTSDGRQYPAIRTPKPDEAESMNTAQCDIRGRKLPDETVMSRANAAEMAAAGYTTRQIAAELGVGIVSLSRRLKKVGISVPADKVAGKPQMIDPNRVCGQIVQDCESMVAHLSLIDMDRLDVSQVGEWAVSMADSVKSLNLFVRKLRQLSGDNK